MKRKTKSTILMQNDGNFHISFPWPDALLCGNSKADRRKITAIRRAARDLGYYLTKEAGVELRGDTVEMWMTLCPPDRRRRDWDNVVRGFKAAQDGMFRALDMDDSAVRRVVIEWGEVVKGGSILVKLEAA